MVIIGNWWWAFMFALIAFSAMRSTKRHVVSGHGMRNPRYIRQISIPWALLTVALFVGTVCGLVIQMNAAMPGMHY